MKNLNKKTWQKYKKEVYYIISNKERVLNYDSKRKYE